MDASQFVRTLTAFADTPADLDLRKGRLLVQLRDDLIEVTVSQKEGMLFVIDNGEEWPAVKWIITRVARLPILADRILTYVHNEQNFVIPSGNLLDQLDIAPDEKEVVVGDTMDKLKEILNRRPAGTSTLLYLTSDAGEGKTTLIHELARSQASAYKSKKTDWLLLPILLGGRPFLRFDEVVVGALLNRFRFPILYYDAFVELVKLGVIVPALDGFEEMFVEGASGEGVSALGNLLSTLQASGTVLIAARKAFFEYKSLETQARLFDTLGRMSVSFARLALRRWSKSHFLEYSEKRSVPDGEDIYNEVAQRLGEQHPLLTRAVLVRRLLDVASNVADRKTLLEQLSATPQHFFAQFVNTIVEREANEKWIDRQGDPAGPLLTADEHHELLMLIAQEMWNAASANLRADVLDAICELLCERKHKKASVNRQVIERIKQHALMRRSDATKDQFSFDHEEFYHYYLAQAVGRTIVDGTDPQIRDIVRVGPLPPFVLDVAAHYLRGFSDTSSIENKIQMACRSEGVASFSRENAGALLIRLLDGKGGEPLVIDALSFPSESLRGRRFSNVTFVKCYFQPTSLEGSVLQGCVFRDCSFDRLELHQPTSTSVVLERCKIGMLYLATSDYTYFDPIEVGRLMMRHGFSIVDEDEIVMSSDASVIEPDEDLRTAERALRAFLRTTEINESVLRRKMGAKATYFFDRVLPELMRKRVMIEVPYHGAGQQRRFGINTPFEAITDALRKSGGNFRRWIALINVND